MVGLLSLSNELLLQVFSSSDTIQSAAILSHVNKILHSLWVTHNNQILTNILPHQIIGYNDAKDLAIIEEIWFKENTELASETSGRPRVRLYLSTLLRNANLATSATAAKNALREEKDTARVASCHIAYYRMRKIVLGRLHPEAQLQHVMHSTINISPQDDKDALVQFNGFLRRGEHRYRRTAQRDTNAEGEEPMRDAFALLHGSVLADHFQYVSDAIHVWRMDIIKTIKERLQKTFLQMETDGDLLEESVQEMNTCGEEFEKSLQSAKTKGGKLQKSGVPAMKINMEKLQKSALIVKTNAEKLQESILAVEISQQQLQKSAPAVSTNTKELLKNIQEVESLKTSVEATRKTALEVDDMMEKFRRVFWHGRPTS